MANKHWQVIAEHFSRLSDMVPSAQELALSKLAHDDPSIHDEVAALLAADAQPHPILERQDASSEAEARIGTQIGSYRLRKLLGKGGMGAVYLADRMSGDFEQEVALKLTRLSGRSADLEAHFQAERQILARLRHPNIAALYDGGWSESGEAFFTMEYVQGQSLVRYCQQQELSQTARMQLFLQVCEAVSHAHQQLIVHLDLKPGNILVNAEGQVKLLDFGLGRMLQQDAQGQTEASSRMTLAYASPEQLAKQPLHTASDLYSLGVILYELLTERLPIPQQQDSLSNWKHRLQSEDFPPPSQHKPALKGDWDAICLKALAREPENRYASVEQFAADIRSTLTNRPISLRSKAGPYRFGKYLRRNRTAAILLSLSLLLLLGTIGVYTWQLRKERNLARQEATKAQQISTLLQDMFLQADPGVNQGESLTARQMLDEGLELLDERLGQQPALYAEMLGLMGLIYSSLNEYERSDSLTELALRKCLTLTAPDPTLIGNAWYHRAELFYSQGEFESADSCLDQAFMSAQAILEPGNELWANFTQLRAFIAQDKGDLDLADSLFKQIFAHTPMKEGEASESLANIIHHLGSIAQSQGRLAEADSLLLLALAMKRKLYEEPHDEIAYTFNYLASTNYKMNRLPQAKSYALAGLQQRRIIYGSEHVETMASIGNLARISFRMGRLDTSLVLYQEMLQVLEAVFGNSPHYYAAGVNSSIGMVYLRLGKFQLAQASFDKSLEIYTMFFPPDHPQNAHPLRGLGLTYLQLQTPKRALPLLQQALAIYEKNAGPDHVNTAQTKGALGRCYLRLGEQEKARPLLEQAYRVLASQSTAEQVEREAVEAALDELLTTNEIAQ